MSFFDTLIGGVKKAAHTASNNAHNNIEDIHDKLMWAGLIAPPQHPAAPPNLAQPWPQIPRQNAQMAQYMTPNQPAPRSPFIPTPFAPPQTMGTQLNQMPVKEYEDGGVNMRLY